MLRRFLLGALVVSLASMAWAGVPDLSASTATINAAAEGASVYVLPNGLGIQFSEAYDVNGDVVDATITLTLIDTQGNFIFAYPSEDLWLQTSADGLAFCEGGTVADLSTDINGQAFWENALLAGGNSFGETVQVYVAGAPLTGTGVNLTFNSADINGDLDVNLSDIVAFTQMLVTYSYDGDFNNDGQVNLSDIVRFTPGIGVQCQ